jgi:preprotein translocase subunit SecA
MTPFSQLDMRCWQVSVRGFGQMNPLEEYRIEGCRLFIGMLENLRRKMVRVMLLSKAMRLKELEESKIESYPRVIE